MANASAGAQDLQMSQDSQCIADSGYPRPYPLPMDWVPAAILIDSLQHACSKGRAGPGPGLITWTPGDRSWISKRSQQTSDLSLDSEMKLFLARLRMLQSPENKVSAQSQLSSLWDCRESMIDQQSLGT